MISAVDSMFSDRNIVVWFSGIRQRWGWMRVGSEVTHYCPSRAKAIKEACDIAKREKVLVTIRNHDHTVAEYNDYRESAQDSCSVQFAKERKIVPSEESIRITIPLVAEVLLTLKEQRKEALEKLRAGLIDACLRDLVVDAIKEFAERELNKGD